MIKFLAVADLHYCHRKQPGERQNYLSAQKLKKIIEEHSSGCDFIVDFGDTADAQDGCGDQRELMSEIADILKSSSLPYYCIIGNHDTSLPKDEITAILSMPHRYYSFDTADYTCLVLDANMNSPDKPYPDKEILWAETYLDPDQLEWLKDSIEKSEKDVLVFCHELFELDNFKDEYDHVILNKQEAVDIFNNSGKVKAVFSGHFHYGNHEVHNDIHYMVFNSLCVHEEYTCAVVTIDSGKVIIEGFGLQPSLEFELKK